MSTAIASDPSIVKVTPTHSESKKHLLESEIGQPSLIRRIYYFVMALLCEVKYLLERCFFTFKEFALGNPAEYIPATTRLFTWKKESKGLYVMIHGLFGRPSIWNRELQALRVSQPECDVRLPFVKSRGNCPLDQAAPPIESMIRDYIEKNPGKPVCIMGVSNGGRIAAELETRLRDTQAPIKLSCVAAATSGSKRMNHIYWLARILCSKKTADELCYQSATAKELWAKMNAPLTEDVVRSYDFYASPNDGIVVPYTGALPTLIDKDASYHVVRGDNHCSVVSTIAQNQIARCTEWMASHSPSSQSEPLIKQVS